MVVTAKLRNPHTGEEIRVNMLIDSGSSITLITQRLADQLHLEGRPSPLKLTGVGNSLSSYDSSNVDVNAVSLDSGKAFALPDVQVIPKITGTVGVRDWRPFLHKYGVEGHAPAESKSIDILLGWKPNPYLLVHKECIAVNQRVLILRSAFGWSVCGFAVRITRKDRVVSYTFEENDIFVAPDSEVNECPSDINVGVDTYVPCTENPSDVNVGEETYVASNECPSEINFGRDINRANFECPTDLKPGQRSKCRFYRLHGGKCGPYVQETLPKRYAQRCQLEYLPNLEDVLEETGLEKELDSDPRAVSAVCEPSEAGHVADDVLVTSLEDSERETQVGHTFEVVHDIDDLVLDSDDDEDVDHGTSGDQEFVEDFTYIASQLLSHSENSEQGRTGEVNLNPTSDSEFTFAAGTEKATTSAEIRQLMDLVQNSTQYDTFPENGDTYENERCMKELKKSYRVIPDPVKGPSVYVAPLWKEGQPSGFKTNYASALKRLESINKSMTQEHFECIDKVFEKYVELGVAEDITEQVEDPYNEEAIWWAHFPVLNPNSKTTPVRPVMDGKFPCLGFHPRKSINQQCFSPGPCLICGLVNVTTRYRMHDVTITGDVEKMFLKVRVWPPEDCKYMRFMWYDKKREKLRYFQFTGHVFGKVCSPTCALYATQRNAQDHADRMPRAAKVVRKSTLVDDSLDSMTTWQEARQVILDLIEMHKAIGLDISKFATNSLKLSESLPEHVQKSEELKFYEQAFGPQQMEYAPGTVPKMPQVRALGQYHNLVTDEFGYKAHTPDADTKWTKTACLSQTMKIYDPLGYAIPVILKAKLLIQQLWKRGTVWTDLLTEEERDVWLKWLTNLPLLEQLKFPRVLKPGLETEWESVQLHVFCDASKDAFASVAYIRVSYKDKRPVYTNFVAAKNNIAPIKVKRTIPKLELMSIEQGSRLAEALTSPECLDIPKAEVTLWSDAKTALQWLRMDSSTLILLIHNYCNKVKARYPITQIRWVPGLENPADIATRPISVEDLVSQKAWTYGPEWLKDDPETWPRLKDLETTTSEVMDGVKKDWKLFTNYFVNKKSKKPKKPQKPAPMAVESGKFELARISSFPLMKRVAARVMRYVHRLRERAQERRAGGTPEPLKDRYEQLRKENQSKLRQLPVYFWTAEVLLHGKKRSIDDSYTFSYVKLPYDTTPGIPNPSSIIPPHLQLTGPELEEAELRLVREHQGEYFLGEIQALQTGRHLMVRSKLRRLGAFIGTTHSILGKEFNFELLRLNGRIGLANHLRPEMKHPYVLHPNDEMVAKVVRDCHGNVMKHMGGVKCLSCELNRSKWVMGSIAYLKRIVRTCVTCRKANPIPTAQQMAPLPEFRIAGDMEERPTPFTVAALDAAGPWYTSEGRGKRIQKRWLIIFRCAKYGAVHLDVLYGMSTDDFLQALSRFLADHAKPRKIVCDNGTNFVRGELEINWKDWWSEVDIDEIRATRPEIEFSFSPAYAPHFNGLVERMIKEVKRNMTHLLTSKLTLQDLHTSFKEVQRLLNNRPVDLKFGSKDPLDLEPLTPAHFLCSGNIHEELAPPHDGPPNTLVEEYRNLQKRLDLFWTRFVQTMTPHLRGYNKWVTKRPEVVVDDIVCLLELPNKEDNTDPRKRYKMGIVTAVSDGLDGTPRRVTIRLANGSEIERALNRIYVILPARQPVAQAPALRRSNRPRTKPKEWHTYALDGINLDQDQGEEVQPFWPSAKYSDDITTGTHVF